VLYTPPQGRESTFESIVWESYDSSVLKDILPIQHQEFLNRQQELALQLGEDKVDAFIAEPGGTTQYYANFSNTLWGLTERPFLLVVTPKEMFLLAPLFEVSRARLLAIPTNYTVKFVTWAEGTKLVIHAYYRCVSI
jgi:Xaa-Pro aminopeptidase